MQIDTFHLMLPPGISGRTDAGIALRAVEHCPSCQAPLFLVFRPEAGETLDVEQELAAALIVIAEAGCGVDAPEVRGVES